ncbi:MAG: hypothetical protein ACFFD2_09440 [Promethearchaeota archaeon]
MNLGLFDDLYLDPGPLDAIVKPKITEHIVELVKLANKYVIPIIKHVDRTYNTSRTIVLTSIGIIFNSFNINSYIGNDPIS